MRKLEPIERAALATVTGAGLWNGVDWVASHLPYNSGWYDKTCPSRYSIVGGGLGMLQSAVQLGALAKTGITPKGAVTQWAIGAVNTVIGATAATSYMDNCEAQKGRGLGRK